MMSNSRIQDQCDRFQQKIAALSDQITLYHFADGVEKAPVQPYRLSRSVIDQYTFVYNQCTSKPAYDEKMFTLYKGALKRHLLKHMPELGRNMQSKIIATYNQIWISYITFGKILSRSIFTYLDRYYIPANDHSPLSQVYIQVFIDGFFSDHAARTFFSAYCAQIRNIRKTKVINNRDLFLFSASLKVINNQKLFSLLTQIYFTEMIAYYQQRIKQDDLQDPMTYLTFVNNSYYFENVLRQHAIIFGREDMEELNKVFSVVLVKDYTRKFINAPYGFINMLKNQKAKELKVVFQVFVRYEGFQNLRVALEDFIKSEGQIKLNQFIDPNCPASDFINSFHQFYSEYSKLISDCFNKNQEMELSLKHGLEKLASKYEKMPQILFKYTRKLLDQGKFESHSEKIIKIFEILSDKDQFLSLYRKSLQDKILANSLVYMIEKKFIEKMDVICGSSLTNLLDKILQDCIESMPNEVVPSQPNFKVIIGSQYHWEKRFNEQITLNLTLFGQIDKIWSKFEQKYIQHFPKKKLTLMPYQTKVSLNMIYEKKQICLKCNLIQACIILYSASKNSVHQEDLILNLTLEKAFVQKFLQELPLIQAEEQAGKYKFNWQFTSSQNIVNLDSIVREQKKVTKNVQQDRQILIQAAIIKTLKRAKKMTFQELIREVNGKIKLFKPTFTNIKSAMEGLKRKDMIKDGESGDIEYIE